MQDKSVAEEGATTRQEEHLSFIVGEQTLSGSRKRGEHHPVIDLLETGWCLAAQLRPALILSLFIFACAQALTLVEPYIIGQLINCAQQINKFDAADNEKIMQRVQLYLLFYVATQVGFWIFTAFGRLLERVIAFHIKANYKTQMIKMLTQMPMKWHREHHSGESIDKINKASNSLYLAYEGCSELTYTAFRFLGAQAILIWFMPQLGFAVLVTTSLTLPLIVLGFDRLFAKQYKQLNILENAVAASVHDYVTNIASVIILRLKAPMLKEIRERIYASLALFKLNSLISESKWLLTSVVVTIMTVVVLSYYMRHAVSHGNALLGGTLFILFEYIRRIGVSFHSLAWIYGRIYKQAIDLKSARPIVEHYESYAVERPFADLPALWKTIEIRNLSFTYEDEKERTHHLNDVDLDLSRGSRIALVGESGSGKSTLLSLMRGIQETELGEVFCDGVQLPHKLRHLAQQTTLIQQHSEIFEGTIRFNITFGMEASEEQLERVIKLARFDPVLKNLPDGLETNLAEKGVNLSGGEKQRLALARGFFFAQGSPILLLDEPTSHVDLENERLIYAALFKTFSDKCIVSAIHGLHLVNLFDAVYVFENGKVLSKRAANYT
jgi:ATP-binding cassette, subfamily B, bacterial